MATTTQHDTIEQVITAVQERWGVTALQRLSQIATRTDGIPTGYAALDALLDSGIQRGAVTCISGTPTCGKTTLALDMLAKVQTSDEVTVYIDTTGALDPEYVEQRGGNLEHLLIVWPQPPTLGLEITRDIVTRNGAGLIVLDASGCSDPPEGLHRALHQLSAAVRRSHYAVICLTANVSNRVSRAMLARADNHLHAERQRWLFSKHTVTGYETRLTVIKSHSGAAGQSITIPVLLHEQRPGS